MTKSIRKLVLTAHVTVSVGWLGSVVAYLALAIAGLESQDAQMVRAAYLSMELIGWNVIVPLALATVVTGLVQSLGTEWGLFRHYWIAVKFVMTVVAVLILLRHMPNVSRIARLAAETSFSADVFAKERIALIIHAAGGLLVLLAATVLSVFKPWGTTAYGRRKHDESRKAALTSRVVSRPEVSDPEVSHPVVAASASVPGSNDSAWWPKVVAAHVLIVLVLLAIVQHVVGGGFRHH
jgi:hypothetical protein